VLGKDQQQPVLKEDGRIGLLMEGITTLQLLWYEPAPHSFVLKIRAQLKSSSVEVTTFCATFMANVPGFVFSRFPIDQSFLKGLSDSNQ